MNLPRQSRRGAVYLLVIMTTALVVAMALGGALVDRSERRAREIELQAARARDLAQSAVDIGLQRIFADSAWRTNLPANGQWMTDQLIGSANQGTLTLVASDPADGSITNDPDDGLLLRGSGALGEARQTIEVLLEARYSPMPCITGALHSGGALSFSTGSRVDSALTLSTNSGATAVLAIVTAPVEAASTILGATFTGGISALAGTRAIPDQTVASTYEGEATTIPFMSIPAAAIRRVVLSPQSNPYGSGNPAGVYLIDCGGSDLTIRDCRIVGTLIIRNAGAGSVITGSVHWEPAQPGYPALIMTRGNLRINTSASALSEATITTNLNPVGTPFRGVSDADTLDSYPSTLRGLFYTTGTLAVSGTVTLQGAIVSLGAASISASATLTVTKDQALESTPPVGFRTGPVMVTAPGTWRRIVE
ncbi:MAG: hypothetical protein ACT4PL_08265 [Phycisphaerales bacterium]